MIGWVIFAGYMVGYVIVFRKTIWIIAWDLGYQSPYGGSREISGDCWLIGGILAFVFCWAWPILVPMYLGWDFICDHAHILAAPPKRIKKEQELREREKRIEQLEREVGIK